MTSEEALEKIYKIPEAERNEAMKRTVLFMETIKKTPTAWERVRVMQVPLDIEQKMFPNPPPQEAT